MSKQMNQREMLAEIRRLIEENEQTERQVQAMMRDMAARGWEPDAVLAREIAAKREETDQLRAWLVSQEAS